MNASVNAHGSASPTPRSDDRLIASRLHTVIVLAAVAAWTYGGTLAAARLGSGLPPHRLRIYLFSMGEEWLTFALVLVDVVRARASLSCIIGERWRSRRDLLRDVGIAAAFWVAAVPILYGLRVLVGASSVGSAVLALAPRDPLEMVLWIAVSVTAGICEEAIFRGYLQRQLVAMTGSRLAGMLLAAAAFGLPHLYQGWRMAIVLGLYGLMFGLLASWRRSVRPGMIAHGWQDTVTGMLVSIVLKR